jgi:enoyl-CoA hydratase/carnithine racemase
MSEGTIEYHGFSVERLDEVAVVRLSAPERMNALDLRTKRELAEVIFHLNLDGVTRSILITGSERAFSAGDDISGRPFEDPGHGHLTTGVPAYSRQPAHTYRVVRSVTQAMLRAVVECDLPTVAAIDGVAVQSGLTLALACDIRVASRGARLSSGTLRFAMLPDEGGHHLLVQYMGLSRALQFVLMAEFLNAEDAARVGLINECVDAPSAYERGLEIARALAAGPATATRLAKRSLRRAAESTLEQSFDFVALAAAVSDYDADMAEGRTAFREKRSARFRRWTAAGPAGGH